MSCKRYNSKTICVNIAQPGHEKKFKTIAWHHQSATLEKNWQMLFSNQKQKILFEMNLFEKSVMFFWIEIKNMLTEEKK